MVLFGWLTRSRPLVLSAFMTRSTGLVLSTQLTRSLLLGLSCPLTRSRLMVLSMLTDSFYGFGSILFDDSLNPFGSLGERG